MSFIACSSYDSCFNQPLELLVFRKVEGWEKKQGLCPFLKDRGHMFCSFQFCHLKKLLYIFKSHLLYNSGNRGCVGGGGLKNTELSVLFNPHSQVYSGTPLSNSPFSHLHPNLSHPALYKYIHVFLVQNTDPQFLVQKPGAQTSCGIQTILDFRNRFNIHTTDCKTSGTRASIPYANSLIFPQTNVPRVIPSEVNEEYVSL